MRKPDLEGKKSRAWLIKPTEKAFADAPERRATFAYWLLHVPGAHPMWEWYVILGIHLRPIEGTPEPHKNFPEATHQIVIMSLSPEVPPPDPDELADGKLLDWLDPWDLLHQVGGLNDGQCQQLVQEMVVAIIEGRMSPDQDYRQLWKISLDATAAHYREGKHKPQ